MSFKLKKINAKVTGGKVDNFNPMNSKFVISLFKLKAKQFKSVPKGFLAIQPMANMIYTGLDYNDDGVINVISEAFGRLVVPINLLDEKSKTASEKLADKFSKPRAKGKLSFKPYDLAGVNTFKTNFNGGRLNPAVLMGNGKDINGTFTYEALINIFLDPNIRMPLLNCTNQLNSKKIE